MPEVFEAIKTTHLLSDETKAKIQDAVKAVLEGIDH
jgi:hypothetical protein